jgi:hypothetical protein
MTKPSICIPPLVCGADLRAYFEEHVVLKPDLNNAELPHYANRFFTVVKPLHVFKKARGRVDKNGDSVSNRIVNLIIPTGATIHVGADSFNTFRSTQASRKMRADKAIVHSIAQYTSRNDRLSEFLWGVHGHWDNVGTDQLDPNLKLSMFKGASEAFSSYERSFRYAPGKTIVPDSFDTVVGACSTGIHFFLNVRDALDY